MTAAESMVRGRPEYFVIRSVAQMRAFSLPLRFRMFDVLSRMGPLAIREMAQALGRPPAALYQHVAILKRTGFIRSAGTRGRGRERSRLYDVVADHVKTAKTGLGPAQRRAYAKLSAALAREALKNFTAAVETGTARREGPARNAAVLHITLAPDTAELARFNRDLDAFAARWTRDASGRRPTLSVAIVLGPVRPRG